METHIRTNTTGNRFLKREVFPYPTSFTLLVTSSMNTALCIYPRSHKLVCKGLDGIHGSAGHTVFVVIGHLYHITKSIHRQLVKLTEWPLSNKTLFMDAKIQLLGPEILFWFFSTTKKLQKPYLSSQAVQKQVVGRIWPLGYSLPTPTLTQKPLSIPAIHKAENLLSLPITLS